MNSYIVFKKIRKKEKYLDLGTDEEQEPQEIENVEKSDEQEHHNVKHRSKREVVIHT